MATLTAELTETLNRWDTIPARGSLNDLDTAPDVCETCGGRGWVLRPEAVCYADEQAAEIPCPRCNSMEIN